MSVTLYTHADCLAHETGSGHPESVARLQRVLQELGSSYLQDSLVKGEVPLAVRQDMALAHSAALLDSLEATCPEQGIIALDADTLMSTGSWQAARRAAGAACQAVDDLLTGKAETAFCATRPPGHHATHDAAMGFCLINHIAIAALRARAAGIERVAVIDFDVHHGNGSQDILTGAEGVLYISTHQSPLYPGSGTTAENIAGNILNVPFPSSSDGELYRQVFSDTVMPALDAFAPQMILVSAGFDAHASDPLASMALHEEDYQWLGATLKDCARRHAHGRLCAVLEGGYNLDALAASVTAFIDGLLQDS